MDSKFGKRLRKSSGPVLITGHTGFKGTWLTLLLESLGIPVVGISLPAEQESLFTKAHRLGVITESFFDIRNHELVLSFIERTNPSAIFHFAAQSLVLQSFKTPRETFETNVLGTANILDAAIKSKSVLGVVVATTDKVYKNDDLGKFFVESDALHGKDPYSASKVGTEAVVAAWQQLSSIGGGPKIISVRAGNVVGGGDWSSNRILPDLIRGFSAKSVVSIRNPQSSRPWQHALDPLKGYIMALEKMLQGTELDSMNFGPDSRSLTVEQVVEISRNAWTSETEIEYSHDFSTSDFEARVLQLDSTKAKEILNWKPRWSQEESIIATIEWWDKVLNKGISPIEACQADINFLISK